MKHSKKIIIGTLAICTIAALGIGGTLSFLTDSEQVTNRFSMGDLDITIDEPSWNDGTPDETDPSEPPGATDPTEPGQRGDGEGLKPGDSRDKDPTVTSVTGDSYMRVIMMIKDRSGEIIEDEERLDLIMQTVRYAPEDNALIEGESYSLEDIASYSMINEDLFTEDRERTSPGTYYYNYNGIFREGSSAQLFSDIIVPTDWNDVELKKIGKYKIVLQAQAIQTAGFADSDEAFAELDNEIINRELDKNYKTHDKDSDSDFDIAGTTVSPD